MGLLATIVGVGTYILNKRAVKKEFIPKLEKIDGLISVIKKSDGQETLIDPTC
jgi:hypothetical protein